MSKSFGDPKEEPDAREVLARGDQYAFGRQAVSVEDLGVSADADPVNHPAHYTAYDGIEVIQLTELLNFCRGNAIKYIARAGLKDPSKEIEDLEKARWYIDREINRLNS